MPIVCLTNADKAKKIERKLRHLILAYKEERGASWEEMADATGEVRQLFQYYWNNKNVAFWKYMAVCKKLEIPNEEILEVFEDA